MDIQQVYAVYFSPTHGTRSYVEGIARRLSADYQVIDLTLPEARNREYHFSQTDLVIFGAPVYGGRLPLVEGGIFNRVYGRNTPAIFTVSYGNREFDDALLEVQQVCRFNGFVGIAASAWIAPHTFSRRIAAGRPDAADQAELDRFAHRVKQLLQGELPDKEALAVPQKAVFHPEGTEGCRGCGACAAVCPTGAISLQSPRETRGDRCINCLACVAACPNQARQVLHPAYPAVQAKLEENLLAVRKEPACFFCGEV